jgi:probable rRNA maturation factor
MDVILQVDEPFQPDVEPGRIEAALRLTVDFFNQSYSSTPSSATSVTVVVTDNDTLRELNEQYRGVDAPTDVLSFENLPDPDFPELDKVITDNLGDIIIAYPVAQAQALASGHTPQDEITLLAVHGFLHLLGFDHDTPANRQVMWDIQAQTMAELGLAHVQPTES